LDLVVAIKICSGTRSSVHFAILQQGLISKGPLHIRGINVSQAQVEVAKILVRKHNLEHRIHLSHGLAPALPFEPDFDKVLSLDSAYHFNSRELFFIEAHRVLKPQGILALADIIFDVNPSNTQTSKFFGNLYKKIVTTFLSKFLGVPKTNFYSELEYKKLLVRCGFSVVKVEVIPDKFVWEAFLQWIKKFRGEQDQILDKEVLAPFERAAKFMHKLSKNNFIKLVIVVAKKDQPN
jgi:SAM-dependent methyltransferase